MIRYLAFACCGLCAFNATPSYADALYDLNNFLRVDTFCASFTQVVYNAEDIQIDESKGSVLFHRPGRFRWEYISPEPYLILTNGVNLLVYDVPLKQAYLRPTMDTLGQAPLMLLLDNRAVYEDFHIDLLSDSQHPAGEATSWLRLTPKIDDTDFIYFDVGFGQTHLSRLLLYDHFGQHSDIWFYDVKVGCDIATERFRAELPDDVDVITQ